MGRPYESWHGVGLGRRGSSLCIVGAPRMCASSEQCGVHSMYQCGCGSCCPQGGFLLAYRGAATFSVTVVLCEHGSVTSESDCITAMRKMMRINRKYCKRSEPCSHCLLEVFALFIGVLTSVRNLLELVSPRSHRKSVRTVRPCSLYSD